MALSVQRLLTLIKDRVCTPDDDADTLQDKVLVLAGTAVVGFCGIWWGLIYFLVGAWLSAVFPWAVILPLAVGIWHLVRTKSTPVCRTMLCGGVLFCALGFHWSLGTQAGTVVNWSLLGPQMAIIAGSSLREGVLFLAVCAVAFSTILALGSVFGQDNITPQSVTVPYGISVTFQAMNLLCPGATSFAMMWFVLARLRAHKQKLQDSIDEAEQLAQKIVNFDLEDILPAEEGFEDERIVEVLKQVAFNMKLYRPYLPAHLLKQNHREETADADADEAEDGEDEDPDNPVPQCASFVSTRSRSKRSLGRRKTLRKSMATSDGSSVASAERRDSAVSSDVSKPFGKGDARLSIAPHARGARFSVASHLSMSLTKTRGPLATNTLKVPHGTFELPQQRKRGTLLYVRLHCLEQWAEGRTDAESLFTVGRISTMFLEAVLPAVQASKGIVQHMQHHACLASWNIFSSCSMHAQNACHAAVQIRNAVQLLQLNHPGAPFDVSIGLWTGTMVSGSVGTKDSKASSMLGAGMRRVVDLQRYAAATQRGAITNAELQKVIAAAPRSRLLAVDVLALQFDTGGGGRLMPPPSELVYEVVSDLKATADEEWMYELQSSALTQNADSQLAVGFSQLKAGVRDASKLLLSLEPLETSGDREAKRVYSQLKAMLRDGPPPGPYSRSLRELWEPALPSLPASNTVLLDHLSHDLYLDIPTLYA